VQPKQFATSELVDLDPEKESGSNRPPVPTYAAIELSPLTFGSATAGGAPARVEIPNVQTRTTAKRISAEIMWFPPKRMLFGKLNCHDLEPRSLIRDFKSKIH
jgi:hypothetical protein